MNAAAVARADLASLVDPAKFWARVDKTGECWIWTGSLDQYGYGRVSPHRSALGNLRLLVHRVSYELEVAPIPTGLVLDHLCRVRACVRPEHLEPVTQRENTLRGVGLAAELARQTHCIHGHEFNAENTWFSNGGRRRACRKCWASRARVRPAKQRTS